MLSLSHRQCWAVIAVPLFLFLIPAHGQEKPAFTYRRTAAEVRLTFIASQNQKDFDSLKADDFAIVDRDVIVRDFRSFGRTRQMKADVMILLDCSESVERRVQQEMQEVMRLLQESHWLEEDNISVVSFAGVQTKILCAGNCRTWAWSKSLPQPSAAGATPLFDAVVFAAEVLSRRSDPDYRSVLIVFSDGSDTISRHSLSEAIEKALKAEIQIYTVEAAPPGRSRQGAEVLREMASITGGQSFVASEATETMLGRVFDDLRFSHVVTYSVPTQVAGFHELRILPTLNLNLEFRSRQGYFYPGTN